MVETAVHRDRQIAARKACLAQFAGDASAAPDVAHWDAIHGLHQEEVPDYHWEAGRDFPSATPGPEHLVSLARPRVQARQPRDERLTAARRKGPLAAQVQRGVPQALPALQQAHADEWKSPEVHSLPVQQASRLPALLLVQEPALCAPLDQWPRAFPRRLASPLARQEPQARSASLRPALGSIVEAPLVQQASSVRPSPLLLSPLFLLWQPLPLALLLRRLPESFCAPFPQRPRGSSSSASSFP
jgi:hypothetical protein